MLGASTSSWEVRVGTSSVGLRAIRVAAAAHRLQTVGELTAPDRQTIRAVVRDLRDEARILRGEEAPNIDDEPAFAFAGVALHAIRQVPSYLTEATDDPAGALDSLATELELMASDDRSDRESNRAAAIEDVFTRTCELVQASYGHEGELVDSARSS